MRYWSRDASFGEVTTNRWCVWCSGEYLLLMEGCVGDGVRNVGDSETGNGLGETNLLLRILTVKVISAECIKEVVICCDEYDFYRVLQNIIK